jgi:predicted DNA-binding protein
MTVKVRKQIYIETDQEEMLKRLSQETGISEAEIVRQAIDQRTRGLRQLRHGLGAWEEERAFILQRIAQGAVAGERSWQREDLHEL